MNAEHRQKARGNGEGSGVEWSDGMIEIGIGGPDQPTRGYTLHTLHAFIFSRLRPDIMSHTLT